MERCICCNSEIKDDYEKFTRVGYDNKIIYICNICNRNGKLNYRSADYVNEKIYDYVNGNKTKMPLYGIELEFEHKSSYPKFDSFLYSGSKLYRSEIVYGVKRNLKLDLMSSIGYNKILNIIGNVTDDGSLSEDSSEVILYPKSFNWLKYNRTLSDMLEIMRRYGYTDNTEAGLHISFNINSVGRNVVIKIMNFLLDNEQIMRNISMRRNFYYAGFNRDNMLSIPSQNKYVVLSARTRKRAELRLFKGTLSYKRVMRAIEFIDSLINMYSSKYYEGTDFSGYVDYLYLNKERYNILLDFLVERNIIQGVSV